MFKIKGKVIHAETESGVGANGEWTKTVVVIQTASAHRNTAPFTFFNKDAKVAEGDEVEIEFYVGGHPYGDKYYPDLDGKSITVLSESGQHTPTQKQESPKSFIDTEENTHLPF